MKKCINCKGINKDTDKYCRNCGNRLHSIIYYTFINIANILIILSIILISLLFVASFIPF